MAETTELRRNFAGLLRAAATHRLHSVVLVVGVAAAGCVASGPELSEVDSASTVQDNVGSSCSTAVVIGLSKQISDEIGCEHPNNGLTPFQASSTLVISSSAVLKYLEADAKADLIKVSQSSTVQVNSAFRTIAQQYLLYQWYQQGRCGIAIAATVGTSNHESGRAVDLANYSSEITAMANHGWAHDVPGDDVHFDHTASPDIRGQDTKAFQVLWNANHPNDQIATDGSYGPQTEARLKASPATGFPIGPSCLTAQSFGADVVSVNGPDQAPPQTQVHYSIVLKNTGNVDWPATTKLQLASGTSSPLYDPSWTSTTVVTTLGAAVAAGKQGTVDFDVTTPAEDAQTPVSETFELNDAGSKFGTIDVALTVVPGMSGPTSGDGGDTSDGGGGCSAGGGTGGALMLLALTGLVRRRRAA
jgi:uncharacterized protein (TIGR03382 family)